MNKLHNSHFMHHTSSPPEAPRQLGVDPAKAAATWVQTDKKTHEAWGQLIIKKPIAGALLHTMVWQMGSQNAVVVSQKVLADLIGVTDRSIRTAIADLVAGRWIQVIRVGKGRECAYVLNDRVAWAESRQRLNLSLFSAVVVADARDQDIESLDAGPLRRIPVLFPGERQLPSGPGEPPPCQPPLPGFEPDLPATAAADRVAADPVRMCSIDPETGEILGPKP